MTDIYGIDSSLLLSYYAAKTAQRTVTSSAASTAKTGQDSEIEPPWNTPQPDKGLANRINSVTNLDNFIDLNSDGVKAAGDNVDDQALFAVYEALLKTRILAEYAADDNTVTGVLPSLDTKFQGALNDINAYLGSAPTKDAVILPGQKSDEVTSRAVSARTDYNYAGRAQVLASDTPLPGLTSADGFTMTLGKGGNTDTITVDFSEIAGDITMQSIADLANQKIAALTDLDEDGNTVERYRTRLTVTSPGTGLTAMGVRGFVGETLTLAADTEPSLAIAGTVTKSTGGLNQGFLATLDHLDAAAPDIVSKSTISGTEPGAATRAAAEAKAAEDAKSDDSADDGTNLPPPPIPAAQTTARATATDGDGNTYVVGTSAGDFGTQFNQAATQDVYLTKYDSAGNTLWTKLLGASTSATAYALAVDGSGNVVVAGQTNDNLTPTSVIASTDSFVTKYTGSGQEVFTHQAQAAATDGALSLAVDGNGDIYVSGFVAGVIDANATAQGGTDAYLQKLDGHTGAVLSTQQYGTAGDDKPNAVTIASDGNILVLTNEDGHAVLKKLDATDPGNEIFSLDLGDLGAGDVTDMKVDGGAIYLSGYTDNAGFSAGATVNARGGGTDGFVMRLTDAGTSASADYTSFLGGAGDDQVSSLAVDNGNVYAVGATTGGLDGMATENARDAFVAKIDGAGGTIGWTQGLGSAAGASGATSVSVNAKGQSVLSALGLPSGAIAEPRDRNVTSATSVRPGDYFYVSIDGGPKMKVTVAANDSFLSLSQKIDRLSYLKLDASTSFGDEGTGLTLRALRGAQIDILPGDGDRDALKGLGIDPTKIVQDDTLTKKTGDDTTDDGTDADTADDTAQKVWGLGLDGGLSLTSKAAAKYAMTRIDDALQTIRDAFRALNPDPLVEQLKKLSANGQGSVSPYQTAQLANYQAGLARLSAGTNEASLLL
jgi:hypothetical protein